MPDFEWGYPEVDADWTADDLVDAYYIEGRKYEKDPGPDATPNPYRHGPLQSSDEVMTWLHHEAPFEPPVPPTDKPWGKPLGGFRLLIFDRTKFYPLALAIDKKSTLAVHSVFQLVPETLPVLSTAEGSQRYRFQRNGTPKARSLQVLIQSNQILKVANFMISLSFDFETKWTTAIACIENEDSDDPYVTRIQHVLSATKMNRGLWAHPTFLPTIFARHYGDEMRESRAILRGDVTHINRRLGVSTARSFRPEGLPDDWPESLDFRWLITNTYARRVEVMQVREGCKWSCKSLKFLRDLEVEVGKEEILDWDCSHNMQKVLEYHLSVLEGTEGRFATLQEESEASTNMLFNAITQRDSIIAQRYNDIQKKIATSTKEDSISMSTFTFITALFLPGTFICAFLSLTMIDWQPEFLTATTGSTSPSATGTSGTGEVDINIEDGSGSAQISRFYWVFWAIDIPLTFLVLMGWYLWFKRAKKTWIRDNNIILDPRGERDSLDKKDGRSSRSGSSISSGYGSPVGRRIIRRRRAGSVSSGYYTDESGSVKGRWYGRFGVGGLVRSFWDGVKAGYKGKFKKGGGDDNSSYFSGRTSRSRSRSRSSSPEVIIRRRAGRRRPLGPTSSEMLGPVPENGDINEKTAEEVVEEHVPGDTFSIRSGSRVHTINSKEDDAADHDAVVAVAGTTPAPPSAPAPAEKLKRRSTSNSVGLEKVTSRRADPHPHHHVSAHAATKGKDKDKDDDPTSKDDEGDSFGGGDIVPWNMKKPKRTATWATDEDREKEKDDFFEAKGKELQKKKEKEKKEREEARKAAALATAAATGSEKKKTEEAEKKEERKDRKRQDAEKMGEMERKEERRERKRQDLERMEEEFNKTVAEKEKARERERERERGGRNAEVVGGAERERLDVREMALKEAKVEDELETKEKEKQDDEDAVGDADTSLSATAGRPLAGLRDRLASARRASLVASHDVEGATGKFDVGDVDLEKGNLDAEKGSLRSRKSGKGDKSKEGSVKSGVGNSGA